MIERIIKKYADAHSDKSYSRIADLILAGEDNIELSHRTLRAKISEYRKYKHLKEAAVNYTEQKCCNKPEFCSEEGCNMGVSSGNNWNQEDTINYFKTYPATSQESYNVLKTYVVMGCIHFPFHNKEAWEASLKLIQELKPYGIILNGDILDMNSVSRHNKGKSPIAGLTLEEEYRLANIELTKLDNILGSVDKHYLYGNHEMWYSQYMAEADNSKLGQGVVKSPKEALMLEERGYQVQTDYKTAYVILGDTEVHHGTYVNKHAANKHAESMRRSNVFNHTHRTGSYLEGNLFSYNLGWMGDKTQPVFNYMDRIQKETWTNGFGIITIDEDNISHVEQVTWKNNRFIYAGKSYS